MKLDENGLKINLTRVKLFRDPISFFRSWTLPIIEHILIFDFRSNYKVERNRAKSEQKLRKVGPNTEKASIYQGLRMVLQKSFKFHEKHKIAETILKQ